MQKDELIDLVVKFAAHSFFETIQGRSANPKKAAAMFRRVANAIHEMFDNEELLYDPSGFERQLVDQLERLRGLWEKMPIQIGELILMIMRKVEEAFEDGYLYLEQYDGEDDYFESEEMNTYVARFVETLPSDIQDEYVEQLKDIIDGSGYSTFLSIEQRLP